MGYSNYYEKLKKGLTTSLTAAAGAVSRAAEVAKDLAEDVLTLKCLKDYKLAGHVATAGPGNSWKIFAAVNKKPGAVFPEASVWILDKKGLIDQASRAGRARGFDSFFELQRRSCTQLVKIKHPGVIKVIEPLEETNGQMVFVTEPIFGSLANMITQFREVPSTPDDRAAAVLSPLEAKYGLYHVAETLQFLHQEARLAHCNLNPGSVIITKDGGWKLAGFEFAGGIADFGVQSGAAVAFEYTSAHPSPWEEYSAPPLPFTAPELVGGVSASSGGGAASLSGAADCFSLAALTYQLLAGRQLLQVGSSTGEYRSRLAGLGSADMAGVGGTLQPLLRAMLSQSASARPNAAAFAGCQWFSDDMLLRCLKFLDSILQRDSGQKVAFLRDLATVWQQFDDRLLQHRVLPPIVQEMRSDVVALAALPVVLAIMGRMKPEGFAASGILPVLKPVFEHADGEVLLALVKHLSVFYSLMPSDAHGSVLVPLMLRAFDSSSTRAQEETLKALQRLAPDMPYALLRESLMPRVVGLCLRTTSLVVRTAALALMAQAAHRLDKEAAAAMLDVCGQIVAVDRSAGTAMAVLRLGDAIGKHYGPELTCVKVLPLLCPLLVSPGLNPQLFGSYISSIRSLLDGVAEKTGSSLAAAAEAAGTASAAAAAGGKPAGLRSPAAAGLGVGVGSSGGFAGSGLGGSNDSLGGIVSQPSRTGGSGRSSVAAPSWDTGVGLSGGSSSSTPLGSSSTFSSSIAPAAAPGVQAAAGSWGSAALSSGVGSVGGMSMPSSFSTAGWGGNTGSQQQQSQQLQQQLWPQQQQQQQQQLWPQQQQQQQLWPAEGVGAGSGVPAPDIFNSSDAAGVGSILSGLSVGSQSASTAGFGGSSNASDLFGGLGLSGAAAASGGRPQQQQQQHRAAMPLAPPPSASTQINAGSRGSAALGGSSSNADPFAGLFGGSSGSGINAAPHKAAGLDPFSSLAAPTSSTGDPFASLAAGGARSSGTAAAAGQRPAAAQQQQQWGGDLLM